MRYKQDWEKSKNRLIAFWNHEIIDRCCAAVYAIDRNQMMKNMEDTSKYTAVQNRTDPELIIRRRRAEMETTYYGGEAFPQIFVDLGAAGHAGFFKGAKHEITSRTIWFTPSVENVEDLENIEFDENSYLFKKTLELAKAYAEDSNGDYMISMPDTSGNADALAHLFGSGKLLQAMLEEPEIISGALKKIEYAYERIIQDMFDIVKKNNEGGSCVGWMSTWAPGKHAQMQSDMSVMISNDMFNEFIMPELTAQCSFLDYPIYHFDGVEQLRHLDSLLSLPDPLAIQWTQVAGQPPCTDYIPQMQKILSAGKNLLIIVQPDQIETLMKNLSSKGLYLITYVQSRDDADDILKTITKLTHE